jgi:3-keto-5-aminohexanoate cleavage enzyme
MEKLIVCAAVTGGEHGREANPHQPYTPQEIADEVNRAVDAGAAMAHVHVRFPDGQPAQEPELYREVIARVRAHGDVILNLTTAPGGAIVGDARLRSLELQPEVASFDAGSMNFGAYVFENSPDFLRTLAQRMLDVGTKPELEIFDFGMIGNCLRLHKEGLLRAPLHFQFVLGVPGGAPATVKTLLHMVEAIPEGSTWSATGIGRAWTEMAMVTMVLGGHVRVGMEDAVYLARGRLVESNAQMVERVVRLAAELGRPLASAAEAREILSLPPRP